MEEEEEASVEEVEEVSAAAVEEEAEEEGGASWAQADACANKINKSCFKFYSSGISEALISLTLTYLPFLFSNRTI